jgi:hypothetical protein
MSVTVLTTVLGLVGCFHGTGDTGPDPLHQQVPGSIADMGEAFDA